MTGRELILYILTNKLDDASIEDILDTLFVDAKGLAARFPDVGEATIMTWYNLKVIEGFNIGDKVYFIRDTPDPRVRK